ncbi:GH92 family glycosyl hydrolase [Sunxiuqinia sp. A32]|uniref:GH92 family glycosyl hydrolase n=1 Tax=Sunxiuqinia sp. A32 TaxID=3461496 RepID=UPI004045F304
MNLISNRSFVLPKGIIGVVKFIIFICYIPSVCAQSLEPVDYVNPLIGTASMEDVEYLGNNPAPGEELYYGCLIPGAMAPDALVKLSPISGWHGCCFHVRGSGYKNTDSLIIGFTHRNHVHNRYGNILFIPTVGSIFTSPKTETKQCNSYGSYKDFQTEKATAGYYTVDLVDYGIKVELTATKNCGFHRYTFPQSNQANIQIDLGIAAKMDNFELLEKNGNYEAKIIPNLNSPVKDARLQILDSHTLAGWQLSNNSDTIFFYAEFNKAFLSSGTWKNDIVEPSSKSESGSQIGAYVSFNTSEKEEILVKVGVSLNSVDDAKINMEKELAGLDFDTVRNGTQQKWNNILNNIEVTSSDENDLINFYTSLYRAYDGGFSLGWARPIAVDIFLRGSKWIEDWLCQHPISGRSGFWGPGEAAGVMGIYARSFKNFDVDAAYASLRAGAMERWVGAEDYRKYGYLPGIYPTDSEFISGRGPNCDIVNRTLGYAFDDFAIGTLAKILGKEEDADFFIKSSKNYKNLWDDSTKFFRPKRQDGTFVDPFDPAQPFAEQNYREGTAWIYRWMVMHNVPELINMMGGNDAFISELDKFFSTPYNPNLALRDITGMIGQYCHGNENDRYVPYYYNYAGAPWKTQEIVNKVMTLLHRPSPDGLCGMDDPGFLTGWYASSALGFYHVNPATGYYDIGSPIFPKVKIHLDGPSEGFFVIEAHNVSDKNIYIQSATLNGKNLNVPRFHHSDIKPGGNLIFEMGPLPNKEWGTGK